MRILALIFIVALGFSTGCGGGPKKIDRDKINRNADDAQRDLDRNLGK